MLGTSVVLCTLAASTAAVDYTAGFEFEGGLTELTITMAETATLELFVSTADSDAQMADYVVGWGSSTGSAQGLAFAGDPASHLANWDYSLSNLSSPLADRVSTAVSPSQADDIGGPFSKLIVDRITITPAEAGTWVIAGDVLDFDLIVGDRNDLSAGYMWASGEHTQSVTLNVVAPEPTALWLLAIGSPAMIRRRRELKRGRVQLLARTADLCSLRECPGRIALLPLDGCFRARNWTHPLFPSPFPSPRE